MNQLRKAFLEAVGQHRGLPLLLSGGVDSATVLASLLALGDRPECYTFQFGDYPSTDVRVAADMARTFNLKHTIVQVPRDPDSIVADIREVTPLLSHVLKTHVQCSIPFKYLAQAVRADGHRAALMAMAMDELLGTGRHASVAYGQGGDPAFLAFRKTEHADPTRSNFSCKNVARHFGVELIDIAEAPPVEDVLLGMTHAQLHKPRPKWAMLKAFPEFWRRGAWYRKGDPLQVVSGIRDAHDCLLRTPLNRGHKAVVAIYRDIAEGRA